MKKFLSLLLVIVLGITLAACGSSTPKTTAPESVKISGALATMNVGDTMTLTAAVLPAAASQSVTWSTSSAEIATVSSGKVTAISAGTVTITAVSKADTKISSSVSIVVSKTAADTLSIVAPNDATSIEIGATLQLSALLSSGEGGVFTWSVDDEAIATVSEAGLVTGVAAGEATITVVSGTLSATFFLTVTQPYVKIEGVELALKTAGDTVTVGSSVTLVATFFPEGANADVTYTTDADDYGQIVNNKKILGVAVGTVTVTVTATDAQGVIVTNTHDFYVVEQGSLTAVKPSSVIVTGAHLVYEGNSLQLQATVYENGAPQNVKWSSSDDTVAKVDSQGVVIGVKEGEAYIIATTVFPNESGDDVASSGFRMIVQTKPALEAYPDMNGYDIKIMQASSALTEIDPRLDGYTLADKDAKLQAWNDTESNFNCTISVVPYPDTAPWGPIRNAWIIKQASLGDAQSDFYINDSQFLKTLVDGKSALDVTEFYNKYGNNYLPIVSQQALSNGGKLYGVGERMSYSIPIYYGLFYNYNMLKTLGLQDPAELFNNGTWNYTAFKAWVQAAQTALPDGSYVMTGRWCYFWYAMAAAAGIRMVDTTGMSVNIGDQYASNIYTLMRDIYDMGAWDPAASGDTSSSFATQTALMHQGEYWFVRNADRWSSEYWGNGTTEYGYVPYPWPDTLTKEETRISISSETFMMMASERKYPDGIEASYVYRAVVEMLLKTGDNLVSDLGYDAYETRVSEAEKRISNTAGIEALAYWTQDKLLFDPLITLQSFDITGVGTAVDSGVKGGTDYQEIVATYQTALEDLLASKFG